MEKNEAKTKILEALEGGAYAYRSTDNTFVDLDDTRLGGVECAEAVNELCNDGSIEQIPSAGQVRTTIAYKVAKHQ